MNFEALIPILSWFTPFVSVLMFHKVQVSRTDKKRLEMRSRDKQRGNERDRDQNIERSIETLERESRFGYKEKNIGMKIFFIFNITVKP